MTKREQAEQDLAEAQQLAERAQAAVIQAMVNVERKRGFLEGIIACEPASDPPPVDPTASEV